MLKTLFIALLLKVNNNQFVFESGAEEIIDLVFTNEQSVLTQAECEVILKQRRHEADQFYQSLLPARASAEDQRIFRQAMAGMIWNKQFYHFYVARWQDSDKIAPPKERIGIRNRHWRHLKAHDIIAMPDCWDSAYQAMVHAVIDIDFAKQQMELLLNERYIHPNGHLPAYE